VQNSFSPHEAFQLGQGNGLARSQVILYSLQENPFAIQWKFHMFLFLMNPCGTMVLQPVSTNDNVKTLERKYPDIMDK